MNLLNKFLSRKKRVLSQPGTQPVGIKQHSQPHALNAHMQKSQIKHGELVEANLKNVRITRTNREGNPMPEGTELTAFFCPLESVQVLQRLSPGDNQPLPGEVKLHNLVLPNDFKDGLYDINNVMVLPNGAINVMATKHTTLEQVNR